MIFKQWQEIANGAKTQIRRIVKSDERLLIEGYDQPTVVITTVYSFKGVDWMGQSGVFNGHNDRVKWQVGRDYAVVPGRGRPAIHWCENQHEIMVPVEIDKVKLNDSTVWETAKTDVFLVDNKPDRVNWLNNEGFYPLRIRIAEIRREPLQEISEADAIAEGCSAELMTGFGPSAQYSHVASYRDLWNSINTCKGMRWEDNPQVWVLTFEVVK